MQISPGVPAPTRWCKAGAAQPRHNRGRATIATNPTNPRIPTSPYTPMLPTIPTTPSIRVSPPTLPIFHSPAGHTRLLPCFSVRRGAVVEGLRV